MRLSTVIKHLTQEYETITKQDVLHIRKPMSFALYQTWRWCDTHEKEKPNAMQKRKIAGYRLKEAMKLANKTRNEILIALQRDYGMNVGKAMLSQYINGKKHIPDYIAIYISEILKIDAGYLMGTDNYSAAGNDYKTYISMTSTLDAMYKLHDTNKNLC